MRHRPSLTDFCAQRLIEPARKQSPANSWLPDAFAACGPGEWLGGAYLCFVSTDRPNQAGSAWQFKGNLILHDEAYGEVVLDVLEGNRIGGIEFLDWL